MLTKQNISMSEEANIGHRTTKVARQEYGGVNNVSTTLDVINVAENSHFMHTESLDRN